MGYNNISNVLTDAVRARLARRCSRKNGLEAFSAAFGESMLSQYNRAFPKNKKCAVFGALFVVPFVFAQNFVCQRQSMPSYAQ